MDFDRADTADRPLFHDWIRIGAQSGGGSPLGISFDGILSRDRHGSFCRCRFLCSRDCRGSLRRAVARFAWQALRHRYRIRTSSRSAMACSPDPGHGHVRTFSMLQRELRGIEPFVIRLWPPRDNSSALWGGSCEISDAVCRSSWDHRGDAGGRSARRRAARTRHGSRVDGLCVGLDGCLRVVLAGGKTDFHARRDGSRHHGLVAALSYESLTHYSGPLFACRMDRIGHLAGPRRHPPHSKLIKALVYTFEANHFAIDDPFPPSWTTDDSHLWPHGRDRTARCGLHSASGFQSPARATAELQFEQEPKI